MNTGTIRPFVITRYSSNNKENITLNTFFQTMDVLYEGTPSIQS